MTQTLNSFHIDGQPVVVICCEKRVCSLAESGRKGPRGGAGTLAERAGRVRAKPLGTREHSTSFDYAGL